MTALSYYDVPPSNPKQRRTAMFLILSVVTAGVMWAAVSAIASCSHDTGLYWVDTNDIVGGDNLVECSPQSITYNRIRVQEKVGPVWTTRAADDWSGSTHNSVVVASYNCNGHGTDVWRSQGFFQTSTGGSTTSYAPSSSGVSLSCP